jgi:hypothetical protein
MRPEVYLLGMKLKNYYWFLTLANFEKAILKIVVVFPNKFSMD